MKIDRRSMARGKGLLTARWMLPITIILGILCIIGVVIPILPRRSLLDDDGTVFDKQDAPSSLLQFPVVQKADEDDAESKSSSEYTDTQQVVAAIQAAKQPSSTTTKTLLKVDKKTAMALMKQNSKEEIYDEAWETRRRVAFWRMKNNFEKSEQPYCVFPTFDRKDDKVHYFDFDAYEMTIGEMTPDKKPNKRRRLGHLTSNELKQQDTTTTPENLLSIDDMDEDELDLFLEHQFRLRNHSDTTTSILPARLRRRRLAGVEVTEPARDENDEGRLCFIHIGKTGGTTMSQFIAEAYRSGYITAPRDFVFRNSAISKYTDYIVHDHNINEFNSMENMTHESFLIPVRDPVHRMQSWFDYEHHWKNHFCGKAMVYTCYSTFDELATEGLRGPRPSPMRYDLGMQLTKEQCRHWAWGAIQGSAAANAHNYWNYERYTQRIRRMENKEVFVVRQEHLWEDWKTIDVIMGGPGKQPSPDDEEKSWNANKKGHKKLSDEGRLNVCRALCDEIQVYKQTLILAVNLNDDDRQESLSELQEVCPEEVSLEIRTCSYD